MIPRACGEDDGRAFDDGLDGLDGTIHDELHTHRRGQVEHSVRVLHTFANDVSIANGAEKDAKSWRLFEVGNILMSAGREIIEYEYLMSGGQEALGQVRPNEARASSDQVAHKFLPFRLDY